MAKAEFEHDGRGNVIAPLACEQCGTLLLARGKGACYTKILIDASCEVCDSITSAYLTLNCTHGD